MKNPELGEAVKAARIRVGLERGQLQERAPSVRPRVVERLELRGSEPRPEELRALATALGTTVDVLRGLESPPELDDSMRGLVARHGTRECLRSLVALVRDSS